MPPRIVVVGSVNLDLVVRVERLPEPGETVGGGTFSRVPGGKGANQAVACARLGADVTMIAAVGRDPQAEEALAGLRAAGVELVLQETRGADRRGVDPGRRGGRDDDRRGARRERDPGRGRSAPARRRPLPARDPGRRRPRGMGGMHRALLPQRRAGAAHRGRRGPHRREPARARDARPQGRARRADTGCRGRRPPGRRRGDRTGRSAARRRGGRDGCGRRVHRVPARVAARGALARGSTPSRVRGRRPRRVALRGAAVAADRCRSRRDPRLRR